MKTSDTMAASWHPSDERVSADKWRTREAWLFSAKFHGPGRWQRTRPSQRGQEEVMKPTIYVVDDDEVVRISFEAVLQSDGWPVKVFESAEALLAESSFPATACLLTDFDMPGMDGIQLIETLKAKGIDLPAAMITAATSPTLKARALEAGALAVLEKPVEDSVLFDTLRQLSEK